MWSSLVKARNEGSEAVEYFVVIYDQAELEVALIEENRGLLIKVELPLNICILFISWWRSF